MVPDSWAPFAGLADPDFEEVHAPMWDTRTYVDNVTQNLKFFTASGQAGTTDMANGLFPLTEPYLLKAIGVLFMSPPWVDDAAAAGALLPGRANDIWQLATKGWLDLGLGKTGYGPFPLWKLSPGAGLHGMMTGSGGEAANLVHSILQLGTPNTDGLFKLQKGMILPPNTVLPVEIKWPAAVDTATANIDIRLYFDGILAKKI